MNTAHALSHIDDGDFETLVTLYLRYRHPHLAGLIRTGTNESGEPIKCRVDGILYVPGKPPRCVAVAYTVAEHKELRRKWLGGKKGRTYEPGDIKKADEEFDAWRGQVPQPLLTLYLATNCFIKSDTDLVKEAVSRGRASGIEVEIIEGSQLVDFLDFDPEGQYLREVFLKVSAGRLSESLLRRIAARSLKQHRLTFSLGVGGAHEITRESHAEVLAALRNQSYKLIGLRGESGLGKSTLLRQVADSVNGEGGICLWVPAEDVAAHSSPAALMLKVLRGFHPSLDAHAGDKALDIASGILGGVLAFVDDVNRLPSPAEALKALRLLADQANDVGTRLRFLVPLWPGQLVAATGTSVREPNGWRFINIPSYSAHERQTLAATFSGTASTEILPLIDALSGDPLLCGLALPSNQDLPPAGIGRTHLNLTK